MPGTLRTEGLPLGRLIAGAIAGFGAILIACPPAEAAHGHRGTGYGVAGGVTPELALANVFSGIYGLGYTYDRAHYDFNGCVPWPRDPREGRTGPYCSRRGE